MTHTYANKNKEQPGGFAGRIFKEEQFRKTIKQLKKIRISERIVLFESSCLNMHPWQHSTTHFGKSK